MPPKKRKSSPKKKTSTVSKTKTVKTGKPSKAVQEISKAEKALQEARKRVSELRRKMGHKMVPDYTLKDPEGHPVALSSLFGTKDDLIIIHNMGKSCPYCTLWADGLMGFKKHLENRAGLALVSHDRPSVLREFASGRGWNFKYLSNDGGPFSKDMGFQDDNGNPWPGISTFHREPNGAIKRISYAFFGPGDDFCSIWHMFDMLKDGAKGWEPKYSY
jgi:predicted dithiol-disulfide oxidoreductase (DUF899 family)